MRWNEKEYKRGMLEGGEGYNPYRRREESAEPEWSRLLGQIDRLRSILAATSIHDPRYKEIAAEIDNLTQRYNASKGKEE